MKKGEITSFCAIWGFLSICLLQCNSALAQPFANPDPTLFANDVDGTGYFVPNSGLILTDQFDLFILAGIGHINTGFYFQGNPSQQNEIFGTDDNIGESAIVDFSSNVIFDIDASAVQSSFTGSGNIGFYISLFDTSNTLLTTLFTDPTLNPGQADVAGVFPYLSTPDSYLLTFWAPNATGGYDPLSVEITQGMHQGMQPVPEPATLILLGTGLMGLLGLGAKKQRV